MPPFGSTPASRSWGLRRNTVTFVLSRRFEYVAWYGSALDGRESAFELHANGGVPAWRGRMRRYFARYSELANAVLRSLSLDMPKLDLESLRAAPLAPRRPVTPPR